MRPPLQRCALNGCSFRSPLAPWCQRRGLNDRAGRTHESTAPGEDRDFYLSILNSTSTKREARSYLQRFKPPPPAAIVAPEVVTEAPKQLAAPLETDSLHVALVKIRDADSTDDDTLRGVCRTLGRLRRLGLVAVVVVDLPHEGDWRRRAEAQADRIVAAIEGNRGQARRVEGISTTKTGAVEIGVPNILLAPLGRGVIPVLIPSAYDEEQKVTYADPHEIILSLTRLLCASPAKTQQPISLDRIIFLDPLGGIPAPDRPAGAHVFVNMEQEYTDIHAELVAAHNVPHRRALETLRTSLSLLPPTTSAVITTAASAASARLPNRNKNPLIHNLLTDKPIFSSSLPTATSPATQTTLLKHGTPLRIFGSGTKLTDPAIDLPKLVALIEDSFGKRLDVPHYLSRVNTHIAGLIIAGDYEGAAIVTWEQPPAAAARPVCYLDKFAVLKRAQGVGGVADVVFKAMVAGVRPGGLFENADGIVWRSRRGNVVNRWYFDRAKGTYKLKEGGDRWTMFWTTSVSGERFLEYVQVCGGIEPSLRDAAG